MEKRTRLQNVILVILAVMTAAALALLIYNRTQPGILFREAFLKQDVEGEITLYSGKCKGKDLDITVSPVSGGTAVSFTEKGTDWGCNYIVSEWDGEEMSDRSRAVQVTDGAGALLFRGYLHSGEYLMDEDHEFDAENNGFSISIGYAGMDDWEDYEPSMLSVIKLALEPEVVHRGSVSLFLLMVLCTLFGVVDILYPQFWFQLKHMLDVRDPEPSDFYIAMQRLGWVVSPVLIAVGYWHAATVLL